MTNNAIFIARLDFLKISGNMGRGDKISDNLLITNDFSLLKDKLISNFSKSIGVLEYEYLSNSNSIIYGLFNIPFVDKSVHHNFIIYNLRIIQFFLTMLWLYRDNSVDFNYGFLQYYEPPNIMISSNNLPLVISNCHGMQETITLTRTELKTPRINLKNSVGDFPDFFKTDGASFIDYRTNPVFNIRASLRRVMRCIFLLNAARAESLLPLKIAYYCIGFESLFSTRFNRNFT